jgi:hypothetical protein
MCEFLIKYTDFVNLDAKKDRAAYKRNMIISIVEDNHNWGIMESKLAWIAAGNSSVNWHGKTVIIRAKNIPVSKANALVDIQNEDDAGTELRDVDGDAVSAILLQNPEDYPPYMYRRRRWWINLDNLPANIKSNLDILGEANVTLGQIRNHIKRIRDNAQFTGLD